MKALSGALKRHAAILFGVVALMWALEIVDQLFLRGWLDRFGIRPRSLEGLWGIVLAPLLHGGFGHLMANTAPFVMLGWLVIVRRTLDFFLVTAIAMLVGGLGVWLLGDPRSVHIGASGVIFGFLGYLLLRGYFERSFTSIALAIIVGIVYGGALWGLLPGERGISWEGHFFGFTGGAGAARLLSRRRPAPV